MCVPAEMRGRQVWRGMLGCPMCGAEFTITDGVAEFRAEGGSAKQGERGEQGEETGLPEYDVEALAAFLDLEGRGGYVCLVGRACRHAPDLAERLEGVHIVGVNAPRGIEPESRVSLLRSSGVIPIRSRHVRAVAVGADHVSDRWLVEAARILLPGLRAVAETDGELPAELQFLARGGGLSVGAKRSG